MNRWISPPVAFGLAILGMWLMKRYIPSGHYSLPYQSAAAAALVVIGVLAVICSLRLFARAGTTPNPMAPGNATELVTSGVYRVSRNPMYLGDAIMLLGVAVWFGSWFAFVWLGAFILYIDRLQIRAEEAALTARFGDRYARYQREVRRWL